jgi:DNA-binding MarR family transcriptional regulator
MRHNVDPAVEIDVQHVLNAIRRIVQALRQASKHTEKTLGLSAAQLFVLQKIAESGTPLSINALAERTLTHQSSVSVVVTKLVRLELIERLSSKTDARAVELRLTQKGKALLRRMPPLIQDRLRDGIARLSPDERQGLVLGLQLLIEKAGLQEGEPSLFFEDGSGEQA